MLRRNVAGQFVFFGLVNATNGAPLAGATVTVNRGLDGAAQAAATGTVTDMGGGQYRFAPSQADTDGDFIGYHFSATNAVPVSANFVAIGYDPRKAFLDVNLETWLGLAPLSLVAQRVQADALSVPAAVALEASVQSVLSTGGAGPWAGFDPSGAVPASPVAGTYDDVYRQSIDGALKVGSVDGDVTGRLLGQGASPFTGVGARVQDENGNAVATPTDVTADGNATRTQGGAGPWTTAAIPSTQNANVVQLSGNAGAAAKLLESYKAVVTFSCAAGGSTTSVVFATTNPAFTVNDQPNGKIITFADDTITPSLRGQSTDISNFDNGTSTATVTALTTAPAAGDTGVIT